MGGIVGKFRLWNNSNCSNSQPNFLTCQKLNQASEKQLVDHLSQLMRCHEPPERQTTTDLADIRPDSKISQGRPDKLNLYNVCSALMGMKVKVQNSLGSSPTEMIFSFSWSVHIASISKISLLYFNKD